MFLDNKCIVFQVKNKNLIKDEVKDLNIRKIEQFFLKKN